MDINGISNIYFLYLIWFSLISSTNQRGFVAEFEIQTFISRNHRQGDRDRKIIIQHGSGELRFTSHWIEIHAMYISGQSDVRSLSFKKSNMQSYDKHLKYMSWEKVGPGRGAQLFIYIYLSKCMRTHLYELSTSKLTWRCSWRCNQMQSEEFKIGLLVMAVVQTGSFLRSEMDWNGAKAFQL